jgi:hypothetical protein
MPAVFFAVVISAKAEIQVLNVIARLARDLNS